MSISGAWAYGTMHEPIFDGRAVLACLLALRFGPQPGNAKYSLVVYRAILEQITNALDIRHESINRSIYCHSSKSPQSFPRPPNSFSFSYSFSNSSRAPSPCLSCPPSCCPMGSSLEAPSRAAVVSEEVGGGASVAGPVFTPPAKLASAWGRKKERKKEREGTV